MNTFTGEYSFSFILHLKILFLVPDSGYQGCYEQDRYPVRVFHINPGIFFTYNMTAHNCKQDCVVPALAYSAMSQGQWVHLMLIKIMYL